MSAEPLRHGGRLALLIACVASAACGRLHAPRGFLPTPTQAGRDAFGGWVDITYAGVRDSLVLQGELIAVSRDSLWVMEGSFVQGVATQRVHRARLTGYDSQPGHVAGYAALGVVMTLSNGYFLVLTAPAWLIVGTVASRAQASVPVIDIRGPDLAPLARFARFPQGMPDGLDARRLLPRPHSVREDPQHDVDADAVRGR